MTLENPQLALALILILSAIVLIQSAFIIITVLMLGKRLGNLHLKTSDLAEKLSDALETASGAIDKAAVVREKLPVWEGNISRAVSSLARSTRDFDRSAGKALALMRGKVESANRHTDELLAKYSAATFRLHRNIVNPSHQLSAAASAIGAGIARLIFRERKTDGDGGAEQGQMFL